MKVEIKYPKLIMQYGRLICLAKLYDEDNDEIFDGSLVNILKYAEDNEYEIENAQEILVLLVLQNGFAA